jgi:hypothetical protein
MRSLFCAALAAAVFAFAMVGDSADAQQRSRRAAVAADQARVYDMGTVWSIAFVETQPGGFDPYTRYLAEGWRQYMEEAKRMGDVVSYHVLQVESARDGEPDMMLITEYRNMAVFDRSLDELDAIQRRVFGSRTRSDELGVQRGGIRTLRGEMRARELVFRAPPAPPAGQ